MLSRLGLLLTPLALAIVVALIPAYANHGDGHLHDWFATPGVQDGLQQGVIAGTAVSVCSPEFPLSTQTAISRWTSPSALNFSVFTYAATCPGAHVSVTTGSFSTFCLSSSHACVGPTNVSGDPSYEIVNPTFVRMNPNVQVDNTSHTNRDVTHELAHVLGHADYSGCPAGATLMDTTESGGCWQEFPQALDITNYNNAYFADAVTSLSGSSSAPNALALSWTSSHVHSENGFIIQRNGVTIGSTAKNATSWSSSSQPSGSATFAVVSHTNAACLAFGGFCGSASVVVNVQAPPPPARPIDLHWKIETTDPTLEWTDNSTTETTFEVWRCGDGSPLATITSTSTAGTGTKYTRAITISNGTKGCYTVLARNANGASGFAPGVPFLNTTKGNCVSENPCVSHSSKRIEVLVSKLTEGGTTVYYIGRNDGSSTLYSIDFWDNVFGGTHLDGPETESSGNNTGWESHGTTSTNTIVIFWCISSSACADKHWDALGY